jgi:acyl CoA:acetate/3-ketoacid CoA transferase
VPERRVFELASGELKLIEIAPGIVHDFRALKP